MTLQYMQKVLHINEYRHWSRHAVRDILTAPDTFKILLVHGILQFTMIITLCCALHRYLSRDIHRWKLSPRQWKHSSQVSIKHTNVKQLKTRQQKQEGLKHPTCITTHEFCMRTTEISEGISPRRSRRKFTVQIDISCEWSFRRFTYGNLVTTSPSSKW